MEVTTEASIYINKNKKEKYYIYINTDLLKYSIDSTTARHKYVYYFACCMYVGLQLL